MSWELSPQGHVSGITAEGNRFSGLSGGILVDGQRVPVRGFIGSESIEGGRKRRVRLTSPRDYIDASEMSDEQITGWISNVLKGMTPQDYEETGLLSIVV